MPTFAELVQTIDVADDAMLTREEVRRSIDALVRSGDLRLYRGRIGFPESCERIVSQIEERDLFQARKRRRARRVASWLAFLTDVRFVALANTTALGTARDEGDLDFFVVTRAGALWSVRLLGGLPFKLMGQMPTAHNERDAVCLSYFIADNGLNLTSHLLTPDDPYFRYWFLSLLPLYDDGVSTDLWRANVGIVKRHPFAERWIVPPELGINTPRIRLPVRLLEPLARRIQMRWFPKIIRNMMNNDTRVMVNDQTLKFHVTDARAEYRTRYENLCTQRGV